MISALALPLISLAEPDPSAIFDRLWEMPAEWIEPPNERRGGWSGATRVNLPDEQGTHIPCILKKQQNHSYYSVSNGLLPRPTFEREARNLRYLKSVGVPVPELLFHGSRKRPGQHQAVLLIPELVGYQSLESMLLRPEGNHLSRRAIGAAIGRIARQLHYELGWCHRNFYPKHLFIKQLNGEVDVCLIDLENSRPLRRGRQVLDDLGSLLRRAQKTGHVNLFDQVAFLTSYCQCDKIGPAERALMKRIITSK